MKAKRYNSILILIGLLIFIIFIWVRFIRERLPRDIPFELSLLGFIFLFYICLIYVYMLYSLIYEKKLNGVLNKLIYYIFIPLETLDHYIKNLPCLSSYYKRFIIYFVNKLVFILLDSKIYYCIMYIFPRIILVSALLIDTFYFHCISLLYKIILIGLILLISRYIKYSFIYAQEHYIIELESMVNKIRSNYSDKEDPEDDPCDMFITFLTVREFIDVHVSKLGKGLKGYTYYPIPSDEYFEKYRKINNISLTQRLNIEQHKDRDKPFYQIMDIVIPMSVHIEEYYYAENYSRSRYAKALIFSLYLLCWSYILIVSFHTLPMDSITLIINILFSILFTITITINYLYCYYIDT